MNLDKKVAILIDGENISPEYMQFIIKEMSQYGIITYKRVYANWTAPAFLAWQKILFQFAITPMQQFNYSEGKSASDGALIIDAMDILYSNNVDIFCIVSSDSDFTKLASRLRESGKQVFGLGEEKSSNKYVNAFDVFIYLDSFKRKKKTTKKKEVKKETSPISDEIEDVKDDITRLIENNDGEIDLAYLTNLLIRIYPDFNLKKYGYKKMKDFIDSLQIYNINKEGLVANVSLKEE